MSDSAAVQVAKERRGDRQVVEVTLSTGIRARITPVSAALITDSQGKIQDPPIPKWFNPDKEREEENPNDPAYLQALTDADKRRTTAAIDAAVMFGVELVDGLPEDDRWLTNLRFMERRGHLSLDEFDLDDVLDLEFLYKRYIAVSAEDLALVMLKSGIQTEAVAQATRSFQGDGSGPSD